MAKDIKRIELLLHMYQELSARISRVEKDLDDFIHSKNDDPFNSDISKSIPVVERSSSKNGVLYKSSQSSKLSEILDEESINSPLPPIDNKVKEYFSIDDVSDGEISMYRGHRVSVPRVKFSDHEKQSRYDVARAEVFGLLNEGSGTPIYDVEKPIVKDNGAETALCKELSKDPAFRVAVADVISALTRFRKKLTVYVNNHRGIETMLREDKTEDLLLIAYKIREFMK